MVTQGTSEALLLSLLCRLGLMNTNASQVEVLKVEALDVQSKPLLLREKLRIWSSLQILWLWAREWGL